MVRVVTAWYWDSASHSKELSWSISVITNICGQSETICTWICPLCLHCLEASSYQLHRFTCEWWSIFWLIAHHWSDIVVAVDEFDVPVVEADSQDTHPVGGSAVRESHHLLPLLHVELLTVPLKVRDGNVRCEGDLVDDVAVQVHHNDSPLCGGHVHLVVVRRPGAAGDGGVRGQQGGPVPLSGHRPHQHEPVLQTVHGSQSLLIFCLPDFLYRVSPQKVEFVFETNSRALKGFK